jgi:N-acylglucosamine-6-phosphate 2-epimerase
LDIPGNEIYITPTRDSARHVASSGCGLVAIDATQRPRAKDESLEAIVEVLRKEFSVAIVCDVSSVEEGIYAEELGVDAVATTLAAFARDMHGRALPNFELLAALARRLRIPLICEGAISTPHQVRRAFEEGAFAVCVGRALTGLDWLVQQYHEATPRMTQAPTSLTAQERREN